MEVINFWAVLLAGVVNMAVGSIWYGPLFGTAWKKLMGFTDESMKSMKLTPAQAMTMGLVTALIMAYVLGHFVALTGVTGIDGAWQLASWIWLGFLFTTAAGSFLWEGRPFMLFILNAAEQLVAVFLMAVVLVLWR